MSYDLKPLKAPRSAGRLLRMLVGVAETPLAGDALAEKFFSDIGIAAMRKTPASDPPTFLPPVFKHVVSGEAKEVEWPNGGPQREDFPFETAADFVSAYNEGRTTPVEVAEKILDWTANSDRKDPPLRVFIAQNRDDLMRQAKEATARYEAGEPLGPLDGVPVAVKDELDQLGYPTTVGTSFLGTSLAETDAEPVARLRAAGALMIGKANMHEIGMGVTGLNPHHQPARNPYNPTRATGGSSSGSAAAVAAGFCPLSVGADGGGSIRLPAGLCGVVGLKATFGRVSEHGAADLCWSLAHVGPLGVSARDTALGYLLMAGPDARDIHTLHAPPLELDGFANHDLSGVRLGIYPAWFEDAEADVVRTCRTLLDRLIERGAELVEIEIPELSLMRSIHLVTIVSEMVAAHLHDREANRDAYGLDVRMNLALGSRMRSSDYVHAQRLRTRLCRHYDQLLTRVDGIVTPTTGCTAPPLMPDALETGDSNINIADRIMRFAVAANVTGLPAVSVPAGYDYQGLPTGLQIMGRPWSESFLLRLASVAEAVVERRLPRIHRSLLG